MPMMTDRQAGLFESAVGMLPMSEARALELFTEITNDDEWACDAWVGRIRCGDTDRVTLFRAWYSRTRFGHLAGSAQISMNAVGARVPIGGLYGDITYPVNSPLAITLGFAVSEAAQGNFADAMEALDETPVGSAEEYLVAWTRAVVHGAAQRWTDVIDQVKTAGRWPDSFLAGAAAVAHGVAAASLGLFTEAERRLTEANSSPAGEACAAAIAWYLAMARRSLGNEDGAVALFEWLQTTHPGPKVTSALKDPSYRLVTTSAEQIAARTDPWDASTVVADTSARDELLAVAEAELNRQIGLTHVKEQIERYRAATQMARVRAARGMKVAQPSKHMIFAGPPGTGKTTVARVVANILAGLGVIAEPTLVETSRKDFVAEFEGQSAVKTTKTIDRALGGVLFIDEAYALVQERDGRADPFGTEALDTLLARMENDRDRLVVIIAGYSTDIDRLLETNEGLRSRFATRIEFESYSPEELLEIAKVIAAGNDSLLSVDASELLLQAAKQLSQQTARGKPAIDVAGNGRYARQLVEAAEQYRDIRLTRATDVEALDVDALREINGDDMAEAIAAVHGRLNMG
jgi:type VII secretion ATPase EccA